MVEVTDHATAVGLPLPIGPAPEADDACDVRDPEVVIGVGAGAALRAGPAVTDESSVPVKRQRRGARRDIVGAGDQLCLRLEISSVAEKRTKTDQGGRTIAG